MYAILAAVLHSLGMPLFRWGGCANRTQTKGVVDNTQFRFGGRAFIIIWYAPRVYSAGEGSQGGLGRAYLVLQQSMVVLNIGAHA